MSIHRRPIVAFISSITFALGVVAAPALAGDAAPYARVSETSEGIVTLEMCTRTFVPVSGIGPRIHLVSAIHIADKPFYSAMQEQLDSYDTVLFEGVKPAGFNPIDPELDDQDKADATRDRLALLLGITEQFYANHGRLPSGFDDLIENADTRVVAIIKSVRSDGWDHPITLTRTDSELGNTSTQRIAFTSLGADHARGGEGAAADITLSSDPYTSGDNRPQSPVGIQTQLAGALHVSFQLDEMDTSKSDWINADIDINQLQEQLAALGGDNTQILKLLEGDSFQAKLIGFVLKFVSRSPQLSSMMKLAMMDVLVAAETGDMMSQMAGMEEVILHGRNATVIGYLRAQLASDKDAKDIAIFYGAAHMPGLEETITGELGYEFESDAWADAMSVDTADTGLAPAQVKMMRSMIRSSLERQL